MAILWYFWVLVAWSVIPSVQWRKYWGSFEHFLEGGLLRPADWKLHLSHFLVKIHVEKFKYQYSTKYCKSQATLKSLMHYSVHLFLNKH